jgi:hypothetical protein
MSKLRLAALGLIASLASAAHAQPSLVGTYRMISTKRTIVATGQVVDYYGKNPIGYIIYTADGHMMALMVEGGRPIRDFKNPMDDATKVKMYNTGGGYGGTYSFDGKKVVHHIDISTGGTPAGTEVVRYVEILDANHLRYTTKPEPSIRDGVVDTVETIWERVPAAEAGK